MPDGDVMRLVTSYKGQKAVSVREKLSARCPLVDNPEIATPPMPSMRYSTVGTAHGLRHGWHISTLGGVRFEQRLLGVMLATKSLVVRPVHVEVGPQAGRDDVVILGRECRAAGPCTDGLLGEDLRSELA